MRRARLVLLLSLAARAEGPAAQLAWAPGHLGTVFPRFYPLDTAVPEGVKPPADLADGRFGLLDLANGIRVAVAHEAGGQRRGLWVDADADGDLAEEGPARWSAGEHWPSTTATVRIPVAGEGEPRSVLLLFKRERSDVHDRLGVITRAHRRGTVELGARLRPVALVDGNGDFRFDDVEHDRAFLDLDGDGEIQVGYEELRIGEAFDLAREGYAAEVPETLGSAVTFRRVPKAPAPRRWLVPPEPPPVRHTGPAPAEPFAEFSARFDPRTSLLVAARYGTPESFRLLLQVCSVEAVQQMGYAEYVGQEDEVARLARAHPVRDVRRAAVAALHAMGAPGRSKVYEAIVRETKDEADMDVVEDAARHLAYLGTPQSRATLLDAFRDQRNEQLRLQVFQGGTGGDPEGPPKALVDLALADEFEGIRYQALEKCWKMRDPRARTKAIEALASREEMTFGLAAAVIRVLAYEPDKAAMRALLPFTERASDDILRMLTHALKNARDPEVTRAVVAGLGEPSERARCFCVDLLTWIPDPSILPALLKAVAKEKHPEAARRMLLAIGQQESVPIDALARLARRADFPARGEVLRVLARIGRDDPAVVQLFAEALVSRSPEERILALDVVAKTGDPSSAPAILACLGHEAWQVRLAAVEALRGVRVREAVLPLIERLDKEESARVREAISETLFSLTGQDLLDAADAWRAWWRERGASFEVPAKPPQRKADAGGTVARFYGLPVRTERVCFVLDRSDSMEGTVRGGRTKLQVAVEELEAAVKRLPDRARVNIVLFDTEVENWKKSLVPLTDSNRAALRAFVEKQTPKGLTNVYDALEAALLTEGVDSIFLLSDGAPTAGEYRETGVFLAAARRLNQTRRIAIHTVAVGHDSDLLRRLAEENGGRYARR